MTRECLILTAAGAMMALGAAAPPVPVRAIPPGPVAPSRPAVMSSKPAPAPAPRASAPPVAQASPVSVSGHSTVRRTRRDPRRFRTDPITVANRAATEEPAAQSFINATQVFPFADGMVYHVYTAPGRITDIALQPGEGLGAVASGDTVRWVIGDTSSGEGTDRRAHILVKPFAAGLSTNLVVTSDKRTYHLALTSTRETAMAAVSWSYPADQLIALRKASDDAKAAAPIATGLDVAQLRFDYAISGDRPGWRPLRAFDDGRQTFIEFPATIATGEAPPLFVIGTKGEAQLVNYRVSGRYYVVDRLFDAAELRLGSKHQQVVQISRTSSDQPKRWAS